MKQSTEIAQLLLNFATAGFFAADPMVLSQIELKLSSQDFHGLAVRAPAEVNVTERDTLPVVLASQFTASRDWETPLADNLAILLFDHVTAEVSTAKPFEDSTENRPDPGRPSTKSPKPSGDAATGIATSVRKVDLRKLFSLGWHSRRLTVLALSYDVVSNETDVALVGGKTSAARPRGVTPSPGSSGCGLPSYDPAAIGIKSGGKSVTFAVDVKSIPRSCLVKGSITTVATHRHLQSGVAEKKPVAAVIPVTCIVVGRDWRTPWTFEWGIPVYSEKSFTVGDSLSAVFSVPLPAERLALLIKGDYVAYMIVEGRVFGPQRFSMPDSQR